MFSLLGVSRSSNTKRSGRSELSDIYRHWRMSDRTSSVFERRQVQWWEQVCGEVLENTQHWTRIVSAHRNWCTSIKIDHVVDKGFERRANASTFGYWMTFIPVSTRKLIEILETRPVMITFPWSTRKKRYFARINGGIHRIVGICRQGNTIGSET